MSTRRPASDHQMLCEIWDVLLATAPPERVVVTAANGATPGCTADAVRQSGKWKTVEPADQPQPASDGALAYANELIEDFLANEECGCAKGVYPHPCPRCIVTIEEARKYIATCTVPEAALASHDQKVRNV